MQRINPEAPLMPWIASRLPSGVPISETRILDVGAGPVSCIGWQVAGERPSVTPIDALANHYRVILDEFGLTPPIYTQLCDGEDIDQLFGQKSFDVVHIRNALDHCYDAVAVVRNMLSVLKPGGSLLIHGFTDEAEFEQYNGLHQWNIRAEKGELVIWRPGTRHVVNTVFADQLSRVETTQNDKNRWTGATLIKAHSGIYRLISVDPDRVQRPPLAESGASDIHALLVDALLERAAAFYRRYGFQATPDHSLTLYLLLGKG